MLILGLSIFNQSLVSYFKSSVSQLDSFVNPEDIKYLSNDQSKQSKEDLLFYNNSQTLLTTGDLSEDLLPICEHINATKEYSVGDVMQFEDGRLMVFQVQSPETASTQKSYINICKHYIISEANLEFSKKEKTYFSVLKYYPKNKLLEVNIHENDGYNYKRAFYNLETKKLISIDLPALKNGRAVWAAKDYQFGQYAYLLMYPAPVGGGDCYVESDCEKLMARMKEGFNAGPVYILRSDGKYAELLENNTSMDYNLEFSWNGVAESTYTEITLSDEQGSFGRGLPTNLFTKKESDLFK
jgi:hypothetical protein